MLQHQHLIVRAEVTSPPTDPEYIKTWLGAIITGIGMKLAVGPHANPISYYCELAGNTGLTGVAILETSHCAIHVWDDVSPAMLQFDLYTCSSLDPSDVLGHLAEFNPVKVEYKFLDREAELVELASMPAPPSGRLARLAGRVKKIALGR